MRNYGCNVFVLVQLAVAVVLCDPASNTCEQSGGTGCAAAEEGDASALLQDRLKLLADHDVQVVSEEAVGKVHDIMPHALPSMWSLKYVETTAGQGGFSQLFCMSGCMLIFGLVLAHELFVAYSGKAPFESEVTDERTMKASRRKVQASFFFFWVLLMMDPAVLIPTSYELSNKMGCGPALSGVLISCSYLSSPIGSIGGAVLFRHFSPRTSRMTAVISVFILMLGNLIMALKLDSTDHHGPETMWFLIVVRSVSGVGKMSYVVQFVAYNVTPHTDKSLLSMGVTVAKNLGLCLGPLITAAAIFMMGGREVVASVFSRTSPQIYWTALLWAILGLAFSLTLPLDYRPLVPEGAASAGPGTPRRTQLDRIPIDDRKSIVLQGFLFSFERSLTTACIEAGSAVILETQFGWGSRIIGFSISAVFGATIVVCMMIVYMFGNGMIKEVHGLVGLSMIPLFGSLLLFDFHTGVAAQVLLADTLMYPFMFCASGVSDGMATSLAVPDTWYSLEAYLAAKQSAEPCVRFLAFPLARYILDTGGRNHYASVMMVLGALGVLSCLKICYLIEWKLRDSEVQKD